jgi:hypothetical protein
MPPIIAGVASDYILTIPGLPEEGADIIAI